MEFYGKMEEQNVSVLLKEVSKPVTIFYQERGQQATKEAPHVLTPRLVVKVPVSFRYASDKAIPWNYMSQAVVQEPQAATEQKQKTSVNDITGTGRLTRSGRCYVLINSRAKEGEESVEKGKVKITVSRGKGKEMINEPVIEAEVNEFLKFIKHSEYSIVEQLHKMPIKIFLLALMLNSEPHREAMLKVLKQAYVAHNTPVDKIDRLVGNIMMDNYISSSDDEIPSNDRRSKKVCTSQPR